MTTACIISALVGLGAEVIFTAARGGRRVVLQRGSGWGYSRAWYAIGYAMAPPVLAVLPHWPLARYAIAACILAAADQVVRVVEGAPDLRALRFAWAWLPLAWLLDRVSSGA